MTDASGDPFPGLFEGLPTAIHIYRYDEAEAPPRPRFVAANAAAVRALGEGVVGAPLDEAFPALRGAGVSELCARTAASGAPASLGEVRVGGEGGAIALLINAFPLGGGRVGVAFGDISELK